MYNGLIGGKTDQIKTNNNNNNNKVVMKITHPLSPICRNAKNNRDQQIGWMGEYN